MPAARVVRKVKPVDACLAKGVSIAACTHLNQGAVLVWLFLSSLQLHRQRLPINGITKTSLFEDYCRTPNFTHIPNSSKPGTQTLPWGARLIVSAVRGLGEADFLLLAVLLRFLFKGWGGNRLDFCGFTRAAGSRRYLAHTPEAAQDETVKQGRSQKTKGQTPP